MDQEKQNNSKGQEQIREEQGDRINPQENLSQHGVSQSNSEAIESKKKSKKKSWIWWIVVIIIAVIAICGIFFWQKMNKLNQTEIAPDDIEMNEMSDDREAILEEYTNIAIFGVDNRDNGHYGSGNSDTIIIASINNKTNEVKLVSVYRDTYLRINDDNRYAKANSAYAYNGAVGGISMLNTNFDLDITKYVSVDWYALVDAINLLGGIEIEISEAERQKINEYAPEVERVTGIQTEYLSESGLVTLDGVQATAYARIRKLAGNDFKRTQRQRIMIEAMFNKVKSSDLSTLNSMLDEIFPQIETNLKMNDILSMGMNVAKYQITSTTGFPFDKSTISLSGIGDCVVPITLEDNVIKLHDYLFEQDDDTVSNEVYDISNQIIENTGLDLTSPIDTDSYTTGEEGAEEI